MPHLEVRRALGWEPAQLFELAADVERYPEFLPGWVRARILRRESGAYTTDQVVAFGPIRQRFVSRTVLTPPRRIDVTSSDGPFERFHLIWQFHPLEGRCEIALAADLELRSVVLGRLFGRAILGGIGQLIPAFEARARALYGAPAA